MRIHSHYPHTSRSISSGFARALYFLSKNLVSGTRRSSWAVRLFVTLKYLSRYWISVNFQKYCLGKILNAKCSEVVPINPHEKQAYCDLLKTFCRGKSEFRNNFGIFKSWNFEKSQKSQKIYDFSRKSLLFVMFRYFSMFDDRKMIKWFWNSEFPLQNVFKWPQ